MLSTAAVVQRRLGPNDPSSTTRPARAWDCNRETLAQVKLGHDSGAPDGQFTPGQVLPGPDPAQPIPGQVKQQAMDAVSSLETRTQIRLVNNTGSPVPGHTPTHETQRRAEKIAQMNRMEQDVDAVQKIATKDNFGREYG